MKSLRWEKSKIILRRMIIGFFAALIVGTMIVLIAGATFFSQQRTRLRVQLAAGRHLPQQLAAIKVAGLPLSAADLQVPLPPPSQNAALVYDRLGKTLKLYPLTPSQEILEQFTSDFKPTSADLAQAEVALHERPELLTLVHQAAECPHCVFAHDWKTPSPESILFPEFAIMRTAEYLLMVQSLLLARQGHYGAAVTNETLGFSIAQRAASEDIGISYAVGNGFDAITLNSLKQIVLMSHGSPAVATEVQSVIEKNWKPRSLAASLKGDLAMKQSEVDYLRSTGPTDIGDAPGIYIAMTAMPISPNVRQDWNTMLDVNDAYMLRQMTRAIDSADQPYRVSSPVFLSINNDAARQIYRTQVLAAFLCQINPAMVEHRAQMQALVDVDREAYAVMAAVGKTGHLPDHLPGTFGDPFTDKPLKYRREGKSGFVVYSAGPNGDFDGGKPGVKAKSIQTYFRYPAIPEK